MECGCLWLSEYLGSGWILNLNSKPNDEVITIIIINMRFHPKNLEHTWHTTVVLTKKSDFNCFSLERRSQLHESKQKDENSNDNKQTGDTTSWKKKKIGFGVKEKWNMYVFRFTFVSIRRYSSAYLVTGEWFGNGIRSNSVFHVHVAMCLCLCSLVWNPEILNSE